MKTKTIHSCPFCGSARVEIARTNENACWVECANCGTGSKSFPDRKCAIRFWNRRKPVRAARIVYDDDATFNERLAACR